MLEPLVAPIKKLLVANRGEIACRVIKTAKKMNIETVAIYSSVDRNAMHVKMADEAYLVGGPESQKSYLNKDRILDIAHRSSTSAIHPGYGFLSENYEFCQRCNNEGIVFVGPSPDSIRSMGIKSESKRIMIDARVPVVPGYHGQTQTNDFLMQQADQIGYPLLIKPVRGGGGKGMRIVYKREEFFESLESSRRESLKSFGDQTMLLEKYILRPRHIEVQVFGDSFKNHVHLHERDCSIQRRHQKVIEEAPAPLLSDSKRNDLGVQAVKAAKAVDYLGAGTVEFIMDTDNGEFYFMEMNTRLQVEHPVTEMITGIDLVEWQLLVASGYPIPKKQEDIPMHGHSMEARIYAENPNDNFLPDTGTLSYIVPPTSSGYINAKDLDTIRLDTGVETGDTISPYYDPMISKLVVWDQDRSKAREKLARCLERYSVCGVSTNIDFLKKVVTHEAFAAADVGTDFIEKHYDGLMKDKPLQNTPTYISQKFSTICAALFRFIYDPRELADNAIATSFDIKDSFRMIGAQRPKRTMRFYNPYCQNSLEVTIELTGYLEGQVTIADSESDFKLSNRVKVERCPSVSLNGFNNLRIQIADESQHEFSVQLLSPKTKGESVVIVDEGSNCRELYKLEFNDCFSRKADDTSAVNSLGFKGAISPMPGIIEKILVSVNDKVVKGQNLILVNSMKMEYTSKASDDGVVENITCSVGDIVSKDSVLIKLRQ